jgi:peptidoglycan/xylan/chitin deacetylase (PgdA/CDA1 family)
MLLLPEAKRQEVLAALRDWAGAGPEGRASHRVMTPAELPALARDGFVEIGAHTVTHPRLAALARPEQQSEIQQSQARLKELTGQPVQGFSYPFGRRSDYAPETVALVRESGFGYACSNFAEALTSAADPYQLPRVNVPDCDGEAFARYLAADFGLR